jgi:hypothetical protein
MVGGVADAEGDQGLRAIAALCDGKVSILTEGWRRLIYMQGLRFTVAGVDRTMDALLCLNHDNPTYPTRLYFPEKLGGGLNWHESVSLLGREWHTFSWKDITPDRPYIEILAAHLAPLNPAKAA